MALWQTLSFILTHPLNANHKAAALQRFLCWQIGSRLVRGSVAIPFVDGTRLLVQPGMTGATGNIYCGLHELEDMAFVLHALRPDDLFVDVGANVGSYTILAAGVCGSSTIAVEPVPSTFKHLMDNIRLNNLEARVRARNIGLGAEKTALHFSATLDTENHVLSVEEAEAAPGIRVDVDTMDSLLAGFRPTVIKIDVEGYEAKVLQGARSTLECDQLLAVIMELNRSGLRYGFDETALHDEMVGRGFMPCSYEPFGRALTPLSKKNTTSGNMLYVRDMNAVLTRIRSAPKRKIHGAIL